MSVTTDVPDRIAHYNLLERLGAGGLGELYRARDTKVGRTVALRVMPVQQVGDRAALDAFRNALREAAALSHPNIATLFDFGEQGTRFYIAYEYVAGVTLRQEMSGRAVNPRRAVELGIQITDALAEAHARDIVHQDLRPDTIMVTGKGSAKILEFGLSKWTRGGQARLAAAASPESIGSDPLHVAPYLSPEQALGGVVDARSDLFSAGSIVYEMLTGRAPFAGSPPSTVVMNVIRMTPVRISGIDATLPAELDPIIARALSKDLDGRYQSAASLGAELRSVAAVMDVRSGERSVPDFIPIEEEPRSLAWVGAVLLAAALAAVWWYFL
jgi:serine/threonine-protein kinase